MPRTRISVFKRQREQAKRDRQARKAERREDRKREAEGTTSNPPPDEQIPKP